MNDFDGKTGQGTIKGVNYDCRWRVSVGAENRRAVEARVCH